MNLKEFLTIFALNIIFSYIFYSFTPLEHHFFAGSMYGAIIAGGYCVYVVRFKKPK